jgi:SsrA-binding protein
LKPTPEGEKLIAHNREVHFKFSVEERFEAGLVLKGTEVKSLREGKVSLKESFARFKGAELFLVGLHIAPYTPGNIWNHPPRRPRKLLMHRRELRRLLGKVQERGYTLVPTRMYFKHGIAKIEIGLAKGKKIHDRREDIKKRELDREMGRAIKR